MIWLKIIYGLGVIYTAYIIKTKCLDTYRERWDTEWKINIIMITDPVDLAYFFLSPNILALTTRPRKIKPNPTG